MQRDVEVPAANPVWPARLGSQSSAIATERGEQRTRWTPGRIGHQGAGCCAGVERWSGIRGRDTAPSAAAGCAGPSSRSTATTRGYRSTAGRGYECRAWPSSDRERGVPRPPLLLQPARVPHQDAGVHQQVRLYPGTPFRSSCSVLTRVGPQQPPRGARRAVPAHHFPGRTGSRRGGCGKELHRVTARTSPGVARRTRAAPARVPGGGAGLPSPGTALRMGPGPHVRPGAGRARHHFGGGSAPRLVRVWSPLAALTRATTQDDMEIAPDFFQYMEAMAGVMDRDDSVWAVSAWNDHGQRGFVEDAGAPATACPRPPALTPAGRSPVHAQSACSGATSSPASDG